MNKQIITNSKEELPSVSEQRVNFIRNAIDLIVLDTGYPVLGSTLMTGDIATRKEVRALEHKGLIKGVDVNVPSTLLPGKYTTYRAYYTEREVPDYVTELNTQE